MADESKDAGTLGGLPHFPKDAQDIPDSPLPEEKYSRWIPVLAFVGAIIVPVIAIVVSVPLGLEITLITAAAMVAGGALAGGFIGWLVEERRKDLEARRRHRRE
jgi:hypothetical protein